MFNDKNWLDYIQLTYLFIYEFIKINQRILIKNK